MAASLLPFDLDDAIDLLARTPSVLRALLADLPDPWLRGHEGPDTWTPFDIVGDFVYNFNEFGQIVITNFSDVLNGNKSVEEAMQTAQTQAEELAGRIS